MIYGVGVDLAEVRRFERWVKDPEMIRRFFHEEERTEAGSVAAMCRHYAARFAAKEAFSKALGTGISGFDLRDVYIRKDGEGRPELRFAGKAATLLRLRCGDCRVHVSMSHEKEYAAAFVVIEKT